MSKEIDTTAPNKTLPNDVSNPQIFMENVVFKLDTFIDPASPFLAYFGSLMDFCKSIETHTMFSSRIYKEAEEFVFAHPEMISIVFDANLYLQGYMEANPIYQESVFQLIKGMVRSISTASEYIDEKIDGERPSHAIEYRGELESLGKFLEQISSNPIFAIYRTYSTWFKVIVLFRYYYRDIYLFLQQLQNSNLLEDKR